MLGTSLPFRRSKATNRLKANFALIFAAEAAKKAVSARFGSANGFSEKEHKRKIRLSPAELCFFPGNVLPEPCERVFRFETKPVTFFTFIIQESERLDTSMLEWIHQNLPFILAGISVGGQYALIAIGYTMV